MFREIMTVLLPASYHLRAFGTREKTVHFHGRDSVNGVVIN
jgi:hypothetical protein